MSDSIIYSWKQEWLGYGSSWGISHRDLFLRNCLVVNSGFSIHSSAIGSADRATNLNLERCSFVNLNQFVMSSNSRIECKHCAFMKDYPSGSLAKQYFYFKAIGLKDLPDNFSYRGNRNLYNRPIWSLRIFGEDNRIHWDNELSLSDWQEFTRRGEQQAHILLKPNPFVDQRTAELCIDEVLPPTAFKLKPEYAAYGVDVEKLPAPPPGIHDVLRNLNWPEGK